MGVVESRKLIARFTTGDLMDYALGTLIFGKHKKAYRVYIPNIILHSPIRITQHINEFVKNVGTTESKNNDKKDIVKESESESKNGGIVIPLFDDRDAKDGRAFEFILGLILGSDFAVTISIQNLEEFSTIQAMCNDLDLVDEGTSEMDILNGHFFALIHRMKISNKEEAVRILEVVKWFENTLDIPSPIEQDTVMKLAEIKKIANGETAVDNIKFVKYVSRIDGIDYTEIKVIIKNENTH